MDKDKITWAWEGREPNPYDLEWEDLLTAIRKNEPYNEARRGADASLVSSMGRMSTHTAQPVKFEEMLNCKQEFAPEVDKLTANSPPPVLPDKNGRYPVPQPGKLIMKEYEDFQA